MDKGIPSIKIADHIDVNFHLRASELAARRSPKPIGSCSRQTRGLSPNPDESDCQSYFSRKVTGCFSRLDIHIPKAIAFDLWVTGPFVLSCDGHCPNPLVNRLSLLF